MIVQTTELLPTQEAAMEKFAGREFQESVRPRGGKPTGASTEERKQAADRMRYQLYLLDPSERRMSIEDCAAALLDKTV